ncbi:MAG: hypothetical protein V4556_14720 [Bacteroidota bacterium]
MNGKISLIYCEVKYKIEDEEKLPPCVDWTSIEEKDILEIKKVQKKLFNDEVNLLFAKWQNIFLEGYKNSLMKDIYLEDEKTQCMDIMIGIVPDTEIIHTSHWETVFIYKDLIKIQAYINRIIKKGRKPGYDFIHSPNYLFQEKNKMLPEIYAQSCWNYFEWLNEFEKPQDIDAKPNNPYPEVFKNGYAYEMFIELKQLLINPDTVTADYSFIYHKMFSKSLKAINQSVTQPSFIDFINSQFDADITSRKLPFKNPKHKQGIYNTILSRFKNNI